MRSLFKDLQKSHMKQLKAEGKCPEGEGGAGRPHSRGFVRDSLVKVEVDEKWENSHWEKLKVLYFLPKLHLTLSNNFGVSLKDAP